MYSQQELDDAVASGVITVDAANALRAHIERQRSTAIPDEEQFRLLTGFNDIFVSIAAAILLFAVGWIGQSIGQSTGLVDRRRAVPPSSRRSALPALHGASRYISPRGGAWRCPQSSCCWLSSAVSLRPPCSPSSSAMGPDQFDNNNAAQRSDRLRLQRCNRRGCGLAALATLPCADHRCCRGCRGRRYRPRPVVVGIVPADGDTGAET